MFLCCLEALELRPFASLCDSPILPFDNAIIAQFAFTAQGDVKGEFKNFFAPTPPPLGTDPAKPLILLAQIAICPESRPQLPRLRQPGRNPPPPAAFDTPARLFAPFRAPPSPPPRAPDKRGEQSLFPFALPNGLEPVSPEVLLAAKEIAFWLCKCPCLRQTMCNAVHRANQICYLRQARMNW